MPNNLNTYICSSKKNRKALKQTSPIAFCRYRDNWLALKNQASAQKANALSFVWSYMQNFHAAFILSVFESGLNTTSGASSMCDLKLNNLSLMMNNFCQMWNLMLSPNLSVYGPFFLQSHVM